MAQLFGGGDLTGYSWKDLLDAFSCTECGRCQLECPASTTDKPLNPRQVIHDMKVNLLTNGPLMKRGAAAQHPLIDASAGEGTVSEDAIWSCTTCGACMQACPVFIEQMPKLVQMRRHLVEMQAKFPDELLNLFENIEMRGNPWGITPAERVKWTAQLDVKPFEAGNTEYLFFVGCAGAFDARSKVVTVSHGADPRRRRHLLGHPRQGRNVLRRQPAPAGQRVHLRADRQRQCEETAASAG